MERKATNAIATNRKAQNTDPKCYGRVKSSQCMTTERKNALKAMKHPDFVATKARCKVYENKIAYNNHHGANGETGVRRFSINRAQVQGIAGKKGDC